MIEVERRQEEEEESEADRRRRENLEADRRRWAEEAEEERRAREQGRMEGEAAMEAPYDEGPIASPCVICRARKGTLLSKCGHFYCLGCYYAYWRTKEREYIPRNGLMGIAMIRYGPIPFNKTEIPCAYCRARMGKVIRVFVV